MLALRLLVLAALVPMLDVGCALAFVSNGRWNFTAGGGATGLSGSPAVLTWSVVPDGTIIPGYGNSDLVGFLDSNFGGGPQNVSSWIEDLLKPTFDRWTEVSGLIFQYEENDDGATHGNFSGALGVRGDIRLGGSFIDGPGGTDAFAGFIPNSDITIDTSDIAFYTDPTDDFRNIRNTLMHEIGHSLGLAHLDSTSDFLMEPTFNGAIDGIQIDEIRGIQQLYGDAYERDDFGPNQNNSLATASMLGVLNSGESIAIGQDAGPSTTVTADQSDFVSVANLNDVDYYSFEIGAAGLLDVVVTPTGPNYFEKPSGPGSFAITRSSQVSDLEFELHGPLPQGGTGLLATADSAAIGFAELLVDFAVTEPGTYTVRVAGSSNDVQLYQLRLSLEGTDTDFDSDGDTDGGDFLAWQRGFGQSFAPNDLLAWQATYGGQPPSAVVLSVPEPAGTVVAAITLLLLGTLRNAHRGCERRG